MPEENEPAPEFVGTEPANPRQASEWSGESQQPLAGEPPLEIQPPAQPRTYTAEEVAEIQARIRQEEKDKLYPRINKMDEELKIVRKEREEREKAEKAAAKEAAEQLKAEEEAKLEVRELLEKRNQEWEAKFSSLETERQRDREIFDKEREFNRLQQYLQERVQQEEEWIMPQLRGIISGNSEVEIDQAIEQAKAMTADIMAEVTGQQTQQRQEMRGAAPTAPPVGPMEQLTQYESLTPEDIGSMDMETYKKHRGRLLQAAGRQYGQR